MRISFSAMLLLMLSLFNDQVFFGNKIIPQSAVSTKRTLLPYDSMKTMIFIYRKKLENLAKKRLCTA